MNHDVYSVYRERCRLILRPWRMTAAAAPASEAKRPEWRLRALACPLLYLLLTRLSTHTRYLDVLSQRRSAALSQLPSGLRCWGGGVAKQETVPGPAVPEVESWSPLTTAAARRRCRPPAAAPPPYCPLPIEPMPTRCRPCCCRLFRKEPSPREAARSAQRDIGRNTRDIDR